MSKKNRDIDIDVDLEEVEGGYEPIKVGTYLFRLDELLRKQKKDKSGDYINVKAIAMDVKDESIEKSIGAVHYEIFSLNPKALWKLKVLVKCFVAEPKGTKIPVSEMIGKTFVADVFEDTYDGTTNLKMRKIKSAAGWEGFNCTVDEELNVQYAEGVETLDDKLEARKEAQKKAFSDDPLGDDDEVEI